MSNRLITPDEAPTHLTNIVIYTPVTVICLKIYTSVIEAIQILSTIEVLTGRTGNDGQFRAFPLPETKKQYDKKS